MKLRMMRANAEVCFQVDHRMSLSEWQSVIAWGTFGELQGTDATWAIVPVLNRLLPLWPHAVNRATLAAGMPVDKLVIYRIRLSTYHMAQFLCGPLSTATIPLRCHRLRESRES
jgi:nitroimidazol reductase NimA-like FMN-containing flavoprotein (pyridoxamine 5'-phosphate oxidase superfamily)